MTTGIKISWSYEFRKRVLNKGTSPNGQRMTLGWFYIDCALEFSHDRTGLKQTVFYYTISPDGKTARTDDSLRDLMHDFRRKIRSFRARRRETRDRLQEYQDLYQHRILHMLRRKREETARKKRASLFEPKKPNYHTKHFGVEIECYTTESMRRDRLADIFTTAGITDGIEIKTDGSISPGSDDRDGCAACGGCSGDCYPGCSGDHDPDEECNCAENWECTCEHTCEGQGSGFELTVLGSESKICKRVFDVCSVLNSSEIEAQVNKTCGLHVHLDMRNRNERQRDIAFRNLVMTQGILYAMVPTSRAENAYCKPTTTSMLALELSQSDRYKGINAQSLRDLKTLEIRIHTGSTNPVKITQWMKILDIIASGRECLKPIRTIKELRKQFPRLKGDLIRFIQERVNQFSSGKSRAFRVDGKTIKSVSIQ